MNAIALNDGRQIPQICFGTYLVPAAQTAELVGTALEIGYRHIDTARYYRNETGVGEAVRASGLPRESIWITSKLPFSVQSADNVRRAIDASVAALGTYLVTRPPHNEAPPEADTA